MRRNQKQSAAPANRGRGRFDLPHTTHDAAGWPADAVVVTRAQLPIELVKTTGTEGGS